MLVSAKHQHESAIGIMGDGLLKLLSTQHMAISVCNQVLELVRHQLEMQNRELRPRSTESESAL